MSDMIRTEKKKDREWHLKSYLLLSLVIGFALFLASCTPDKNHSKNGEDKKRAEKQEQADYTPYFLSKPNSASDHLHYTYVTIGTYPQSRMKNKEQTDEIVNLNYDDEGYATGKDFDVYRCKNREDTYDYYKVEDIIWRVIADDGETVILWSDKILDSREFDSVKPNDVQSTNQNDIQSDNADKNQHNIEGNAGSVTWSQSDLREWLNQDFYNCAFRDEEKQSILSAQYENYSSDFGYPMKEKDSYLVDITEDKVAIRDAYDLSLLAYDCPYKMKGNDEKILVYDSSPFLKCESSDYARDRFRESSTELESCTTDFVRGYWTRTPIQNTEYSSMIFISDFGANINTEPDLEGRLNDDKNSLGVRPVIVIKKSDVEKYLTEQP